MPSVAGTITVQQVKYRLVRDVPGTNGPVVEKCIGSDCMGAESWVKLTPQSDPADLWNALQAALSRI